MQILNNTNKYGFIHKIFHWLIAILFFLLFITGEFFHHDFEKPDSLVAFLHYSFGLLVVILVVLRIFWLYLNPKVKIEGTPLSIKIAKIIYKLFYILLIIVPISGYLLASTTEFGGEFVSFFAYDLPALNLINSQEAIAGFIHENTAVFLLILAIFHTLAALKHHFFDRDKTLKKMFF